VKKTLLWLTGVALALIGIWWFWTHTNPKSGTQSEFADYYGLVPSDENDTNPLNAYAESLA
jgi:hypothetical protein